MKFIDCITVCYLSNKYKLNSKRSKEMIILIGVRHAVIHTI